MEPAPHTESGTYAPTGPTNTSLILVIGAVLAAIYAITSSADMPASIDTQTNALTAHALAKTGSPIIPEYESIVAIPETAGRETWVVDSPRGPVAQYPPGAALMGVPLYLLADDELNVVRDLSPPYPDGTGPLLLPDMWPAAVTSVLMSAGAMVLLGLTLSEARLDRRTVTGTMLAVGLGTAVWSVAADSLWQHGPAILLLGLTARSFAQRGRLPLLVIGAALVPLVRPPVIAIVVLGALGASLGRKDWRPVAVSLVGGGLGLIALGVYNRYVFGTFSMSGGYGSGITERVVSPDVGLLVQNLWSAGFASDRGVFVWSPFLLIIAAAVPFVIRAAPMWVRGMAFGSLVYVLFQYLVNRYGGGFDFAFYRYPIEPIYGLAPLGAFGASFLMEQRSRLLDMVLRLAIGLAMLAHAYAAWRF